MNSPYRTSCMGGRVLSVLSVLGVSFSLTACSIGSTGGTRYLDEEGTSLSAATQNGQWAAFGPFLKPVMFAESEALPGPVEIFVDQLGPVRLDASALLAGQIPEPFEVLSETYTYTFDIDRNLPIVAGIAQVYGPQDALGSGGSLQTWVFGVSTAQLATNESHADTTAELSADIASRVLSGVDHAPTLAGRSDLGVIAVEVTGKPEIAPGVTERLIGVDVVRSTEVWFKENGVAQFGEQLADYLVFAEDEHCASAAMTYNVASGVVVEKRAATAAQARFCR